MWPQRRRKTDNDLEEMSQSVVYDNISKDARIRDLIILYDEASILLFESGRKKSDAKKTG